MRIPFFHYTYLDSLSGIIAEGRIVSRAGMTKSQSQFKDISIDPEQSKREELELLEYIPMFPGFYTRLRGYNFNGFMMRNYDDPKVQNKSFYGSFNKVLRFNRKIKYENVITLLVSDQTIYKFADAGRVRFFSDIAIKRISDEYPIANGKELSNRLSEAISDKDISGEVDLLDDGKTSIAFPSDIEAIIVDNVDVKREVEGILKQSNRTSKFTNIFV
jgi:hypothetical protein